MNPTLFRTFTLLILLIAGSWSTSFATHIMGGNANFECINQCTVRVHLRIYRDCTGSSSITATSAAFTPTVTGCTSPTPIDPAWIAAPVVDVTPVCPGQTTNCGSGSFRGVQEYYFTRDYNICNAGACQFDFSWSLCCRNNAITSGSASDNTYLTATFNNATQGCNSTPYFTNVPVPYICAGDTFIFNQGAADPDGDSLSYRLGPCYQGANNNVGYGTGYSPTAPLGPTWDVTIDSVTGDIFMIPQPGSQVVGVMCVFVDEWRNGQVINTIQRDIQVAAIACPPNDPPPIAGVTTVSGAFVNNPVSVTTCVGTQVCFNIAANDPQSTDVLTMWWDESLPGGTFVNIANANQTDTITGPANTSPTARFCWTPTSNGLHTFVVTIMDNACPIPGRVQYTVRILVNSGLQPPNATATLTNNPGNCTEINFVASPPVGGTGPFTYNWNGPGNLNINPSNNLPNFNHIYPGPGSWPYTLVVTDAYGCQGSFASNAVVPSGPTADAGPDMSLCSGFGTVLGGSNTNGTTVQWSGTNTNPLSSTTTAQPNFLLSNPGPNPDTLNYTLTSTIGACTSIDYTNVIVYPIPTVNVTATTTNICDGDTAILVATGGTSYLWSTGETNDSIWVSPNSTTTYTVTAIENGCASAPSSITVNVAPGPVAIISGTENLCPGESGTLTVVGGNNWIWNTGATGSTINVGPLSQDSTFWVVPSVGSCTGQLVSHDINVYTIPTADFTQTTACSGSATQFNDQSQGGSGTVSSWTWDFGDPNSGINNISTQQNPAHTFTAPGTYNVTLTVVSSTSCEHTVTYPVTVNPLPVVDFNFVDVCEDEVMQFNDNSGPAVNNWVWDFDDNGNSNTADPSHNYLAPGAYNVSLTVTDSITGCSNTAVKTAFVHPNPTVDFTWDNKCFNTITEFTDGSSLNDPYGTTLSYWEWNFDDGNTSNDINPVHNFNPGSYDVTLLVSTSKGCEGTITHEVDIEEIAPIVPVNDSVCTGYSALLWTDQVPSDMEVLWLYDPNSTNPFHVGTSFSTPPLAETMTYYVALRDEDGCVSRPIPIKAVKYWTPNIDFEASETKLFVPNAIVEFTSITQHSNYTSILWDFGDGTTSTEGNPVHQYTEPGVYTVTLTMVDENGCEEVVTKQEYIEVVEDLNIWVPSAFTPNGDGLNDEFFVHTTLITDLTIVIMDRWGNQVYNGDNINFRWDGMHSKTGKPVQEGVYSYVIRATTYDGDAVERSGTVTIIR